MGQVCQRRSTEGNAPDLGAKPTAKANAAKPSAAGVSPAARKPAQTNGAPKATPAEQKPAASDRRVGGKTAEEWKVVGNEAVKKADHAAAYEAYSEGLKADPDHAMILSNRALCLEKLGRPEEALEDAQRCMSLRPDFVKAFLRAGTLLRELGRPCEALEVLRKAPTNAEVEQLLTKLKPEAEKADKEHKSKLSSAERLKEEGNALFKKGFFEPALETYSKALKACKDQKSDVAVAIRNNRAGCYQQLSDFHAVVKETNFVLEQQPDNTKALLRRMLAYEPIEKYEEALADARRVISLAPGNEAANKMQHRLSKVVRDKQRDASAAGA